MELDLELGLRMCPFCADSQIWPVYSWWDTAVFYHGVYNLLRNHLHILPFYSHLLITTSHESNKYLV